MTGATDEQFDLNKGQGIDTLDANKWIAFYKFLEFGKTQANDVPPIDSLTWPVFTQLLLNQNTGETRLPLMVMDFEMNRITADGLANGNIVFTRGRNVELKQSDLG